MYLITTVRATHLPDGIVVPEMFCRSSSFTNFPNPTWLKIAWHMGDKPYWNGDGIPKICIGTGILASTKFRRRNVNTENFAVFYCIS